LYLPDNLPYENTVERIGKLLKDIGIDKVDIIVGHGQFKHNLPHGIPVDPPNTYDADIMRQFFKGVCIFGHIHTSSIHKRIIYTGSFERMAHNEEERKGCYMIQYNTDTCEVQHEFIENKGAVPFLTYVAKHEDQSAIDHIKAWLTKKIRKDQPFHLRIVSSNVALRMGLGNVVKENYPKAHITYKKSNVDRSDNHISLKHRFTSDLPQINRSNISESVVGYLKNKGVVISQDRVDQVLNEI
jgi:acyl-CoA hydrolase